MSLHRYLVAIFSGAGVSVIVYLIDAYLASIGIPADGTYIDDALLGLIVGALVFVIERHHELELRRQRQWAYDIDQANHHIRNSLQVIVLRTNLSLSQDPQLSQIIAAVERINWVLREILPPSDEKAPLLDTALPKTPGVESVGSNHSEVA